MKKNLFILFYFTIASAYCCDCRKISKEKDYEMADLVFIGEVIDVNNTNYSIKPKEFYKGGEPDLLFALIDNCSIFPYKGDFWLFYAGKITEDTIYVSQCGWSRNLDAPHNLNSKSIPPPSLPLKDNLESFLNMQNKFYEYQAVMELQCDILSLRTLKIHRESTEIYKSVKLYCRNINILLIINGLMLIAVLLNIFLYYKLYQK
jgi:hypothetical protein